MHTETKLKMHNDYCTQLKNWFCKSIINIKHNLKYLGIKIIN